MDPNDAESIRMEVAANQASSIRDHAAITDQIGTLSDNFSVHNASLVRVSEGVDEIKQCLLGSLEGEKGLIQQVREHESHRQAAIKVMWLSLTAATGAVVASIKALLK